MTIRRSKQSRKKFSREISQSLALLPLLIFSALFLLSCDRKEEQPSSSTEYIEVDLNRFPSHQYNDFPTRKDAERVIASGGALKLTFYGAARIVGGSCTLVEYKGTKILVDAGIFYDRDLIPLDQRFEFEPSEIDYVILTHAHGDHSGRIPLLYRKGYNGSIYSTPATRDIADIMLQLGAGIGVPRHRIDFKNRCIHDRHCELSRNLGPLEHLDVRHPPEWLDIMGYHGCHQCRELMKDMKFALSHDIKGWFQTFDFGQTVRLNEDISFRFHNAGHILGSSQVEMIFGQGEESFNVVFTGDFGNKISPLLKAPDFIRNADYLVTESTYGAVRKDFRAPYFRDFIEDLTHAIQRGERVIIPAFVLSKSQKVISLLAELAYLDQISKHCPIIITSPTVAKLNEIYYKYLMEEPEKYFSPEAIKRRDWRNPFKNPRIFQGSLLNYQRKHGDPGIPSIFLVSSGMMDFASALEMAERYLADPRTNFYIVGWQSPDSVGRAAMRLSELEIKGRKIPVRARVKKFGQFSSHADLNMLLENIAHYRDLKGVIVVHGEAESGVNLAHIVKTEYGYPVFVPAFLDTVWLDKKSFLKAAHDYSPEAHKTRQLDPILELPRYSLEKKYQVAYNNLALAERAYREGKPALALSYANQAARRYPALVDAHYLRGQILRERKSTGEAISAFRKVIELNPHDWRAYLALARIYLEEGDTDQAMVELRSCLFYRPNEVEALALLGKIYCSGGAADVGLELLKAANNLDPENEEVNGKLEETVSQLNDRKIHYIASRNSRYFHYPWCEFARRIKEENAVRYRSRSQFIKKNYLPCSRCNP